MNMSTYFQHFGGENSNISPHFVENYSLNIFNCSMAPKKPKNSSRGLQTDLIWS